MPESRPAKSWRVDTSAWRESAGYRRIFTAGLITQFGSTVSYVAMPLQIARMTNSYVAVGLMAALEILPLIGFGLWGGALADSRDRRRITINTELALAATTAVLLLITLSGHAELWMLYLIGVVSVSLSSLQRPALEAMLPQILTGKQMASAAALNSIRWNTASIVGPSIAGVIVAWAGIPVAYAIDTLTYLISFWLLLGLPRIAAANSGGTSAASLWDGVRYARTRPDLLGTYAIDTIAMLFAFPAALYPFIVLEYRAEWALGFLYAAMSVGSLIAATTSGWVNRVHRHGRAVVIAAVTWGFGIALSGLTSSIWVVLLGLVIAGAADNISGIFRMLIWNLSIPTAMRGRMAAVELLSYSVGPQLGQLRSSLMARVFGLRVSLFAGGILCAAGASTAALGLRQLWRYDVTTDINVRAVNASRTDDDAVEK